jgi:hypothetical protein
LTEICAKEYSTPSKTVNETYTKVTMWLSVLVTPLLHAHVGTLFQIPRRVYET